MELETSALANMRGTKVIDLIDFKKIQSNPIRIKGSIATIKEPNQETEEPTIPKKYKDVNHAKRQWGYFYFN